MIFRAHTKRLSILPPSVPYKNIIIKAYAPSSYMAYILGSSSPGSGSSYNTITVGTSGQMTANNSWFVTDIKCLVLRGWGEHRDVNFGILHEMGHMFDDGRAWKFETEMQTDLKLVYVLYKCGFSAVPSGNSPKTVYTVDNILDCYFAGGNLLKKSTSPLTSKPLQYRQCIRRVRPYSPGYRMGCIQEGVQVVPG